MCHGLMVEMCSDMTNVIIDGVRYVPDVDIKRPDDDNLTAALGELVSLYYFGDWHKANGRVFNAIELIAPELAKLISTDVEAAYIGVRGDDD